MKIKRALVGLMSALLMITSVPMSAFAEEPVVSLGEQMPDVSASVLLFNTECVELPNLGDDIVLTISRKSDNSTIAEIPLTIVKDENGEPVEGYWEGMAIDALTDEVLDELAALQGDLNLDEFSAYVLTTEAEDIYEDLEEEVTDILDGYNVAVKGAPEGHYMFDTMSAVVTSEIVETVLGLLKNVFAEELKNSNPEYVVPDSFAQLIKDYLAYSEISLEDIIGELGGTVEFTENMWEELDEVFEFLCSDEFKGMLTVSAYMDCECPRVIEYEVIHEYYKVCNGQKKLAAKANYGEKTDELDEDAYYVGKSGDTIKASDYVNCNYAEQSYTYMGSYEYFDEYELDEFVLSDEWDAPYGLILRYELEVDEEEFENTIDLSIVEISYEIIHEYYKVYNGEKKLVGEANFGPVDDGFGINYYVGKTGDVVKASDHIACEYNGETYTYIGSYEYLEEYELEEYVLSDDWDNPFGLILRYELEVTQEDFENVEELEPDDDLSGGNEEDVDNPEDKFEENDKIKMETPDNDKAVQTGDHAKTLLYVLLLVAAIVVVVVAVIKKRK